MIRRKFILKSGVLAIMSQLSHTSIGDDSSQKIRPELAKYLGNVESAPESSIQANHKEAADKLGDWLAGRISLGQACQVTIICTGNSRRSMLGAAMGNAISAYLHLPHISFHSGGTMPSAFNKRSIATLKRAGFEIEPTGENAPPGAEGTPNPIYTVRWSADEVVPKMQSLEFSKHYRDQANPQHEFAAILVCSEADEACPAVQGASIRIPAPFNDPKSFDNTPQEAKMYDARRDSIALFMMSALKHAKAKANAKRSN
ncbi:MAG: Protein ArsC [Planctomycetota bacterium]|jgi:arsenate reductase